MKNMKKDKKGFTLVEMIIVCAVIGIAASVAAPSLTSAIVDMRLKDYASTAQRAEDVTVSLTGLQYASNATGGNPLVMDWPGTGEEQKSLLDHYIYIEKGGVYKDGAGRNCFRVAPANIAASDPERVSAGLTEFYKRTMNGLDPPGDWKSGDDTEQQVAHSVYFLLSGSSVDGTVSAVEEGEFVRYKFAWSEYFMTKNGKNYAIYHGIKYSGGSVDAPDGATTAAGWHIYEVRDRNLFYLDMLMGV